MSALIPAHEVRPGDRIVGMPGVTVTAVRYAGQHALGGDVERQRYAVDLSNGRTITYGGDSRVPVLRPVAVDDDTQAEYRARDRGEW